MSNPADDRFYQQYFTKQHELLRKSVREFVKKEIAPYVDQWEEAGGFPRELFKKIGDLGYSSVAYPEEVGGAGGDLFEEIAVNEELMRGGSPGLVASLFSHGIALPPLIKYGTQQQKEKFVKPVVAGDRVAALAVTEPGGGSDVASLQTTAVRSGDEYCKRQQNVYHVCHQRRPDHLRGAHRRSRRPRHQPACHRGRRPRVLGFKQARQNGLVGLGYRGDLF